MNSLSHFAIDRLIAASSDDSLKELIRKAEEKLRSGGQYKIVLRVIIQSIFKKRDITNKESLEEIKISLRFNIKLLETFPSYRWINLENIKRHIVKVLANELDLTMYNEILALSTYLDYLKYFLETIYQHFSHDLVIKLYRETIEDEPLVKKGFSLAESLKIYEILNELMTEMNIPDYFDLELFLDYKLAHLYDYILYYHDYNYQFYSDVLKDRRDIRLPLESMHPEMDARIYQVI